MGDGLASADASPSDDGPAKVAAVFRTERSRVLAVVARMFRDLALAEDAVQDAYIKALEHWPKAGVPDRPAAWLTTVARNAARDRLRRTHLPAPYLVEANAALEPWWSLDEEDIPDERLKLIFACGHPALNPSARIALTLQTVCGLTAQEIGRLLLTPVPTVSQTLVRAKRKISGAGIPFEIPNPEQWPERLETVLSVVYLLFTEGFMPTRGDAPMHSALAEEALRLGRILVHLMPKEPEVLALLALMHLHHARRAARVAEDGTLVSLDRQDRSRWNSDDIATGLSRLQEALQLRRPGPYQIQAAIAALHAEAPRAEDTDWPQIAGLYRILYAEVPSPAVAMAYAVAISMADEPAAGLALLDPMAETLSSNHRYHAVRAELLRRSGDLDGARAALERAQPLAQNTTEQRHIQKMLDDLQA